MEYQRQCKVNIKLAYFLNDIHKSKRINKDIIQEIISKEVDCSFLKSDSFKNTIIIRIPKGTCTHCTIEFIEFVNRIYDSIPSKKIYYITSFLGENETRYFQSKVRYKVMNFPDLNLTFDLEKTNFPYVLFLNDNKLKFPLSCYNEEYIIWNYLKILEYKYNIKE